ncbi:DUF928 domain-containing protein [Argonema galeatum]|uniref:DUF928 domain-containing protein n=1 Tax=Argonema galeatum TaxID=2942762 RepID=UPI002011D288|nr:DUF928 domain-containing protein [Argonema galeatum]MCL1468198.1 DUF928 domain-containing protein [Argonema galeatum A003/A1]
MVILRKQTNVVTGAVSILLIQLIGWSNTPLNQTLKGLSIDLGFNSKALANPPTARKSIEYKPPNRGAPAGTIAGGARLVDPPDTFRGVTPSCDKSLLVPLVPENHAGQTISRHPTFFWYLSDKGFSDTEAPKMVFALKQVGKAEVVFTQQFSIAKAGIIQMELPSEKPELMAEKDYIWSVSVLCNENGKLKNMVVEALIRRVTPTPALTRRLSSASSESDRAITYAQEGFWYDALQALSKASDAKPDDRSITEDFYSLLKQVGLNEVVAQVRKQSQR